jgi:hypothetical protein
MSRSYRHTPIFGTTICDSEKSDKRLANRRLRRKMNETPDEEDAVVPLKREVSNVWDFAKDGKGYWDKATKKDMRK